MTSAVASPSSAKTRLLCLLYLLCVGNSATLRHGHLRVREQSETFPSNDHVLEMAQLSHLVYHMKHSTSGCNATSPTTGEAIIPSYLKCHFYQHDLKQGTQVLVLSHVAKKYLAVVFAGTDDLRTSVADGNIYMKLFGGDDDPPLIAGRVHAGFDNSVFQHGLAEQLLTIVEHHLQPDYRLFTSGHSLGAADAVLLATDMVLQKDKQWNVTSINFGCARIGNRVWMNAVNDLSPRLQVWRLVLGWDLVPRLPSYPFEHVGHTIQMTGNETKIYYNHYGNISKGYASVPLAWGATPYVWVPGALSSHRMIKYLAHLEQVQDQFSLTKFETLDDTPIADDDDFYINPPDDVIMMSDDPGDMLLLLKE